MENINSNNITNSSADILQPKDREKLAKKYSLIKNKLFFLEIALTFIGLVILIVGGINGISGKLSQFLHSNIPNIWLVNGVYLVILSLLQTIIFLPLSFYEGYTLEHKFKLSNHTIMSWAKDKFKSFAVSLVLSLIIIEVIYLLLRQTGNYWWIWAGILWIFFSLILNHLAPILLLPIFFKLTPLRDEDLANRLKKMAQKVGAQILGVFEFDLSKKTKKANAAFTGMGKTKRILLADTLLKEFSPDEVEVILAHELGHYYYKHLWKLMGLGIISTFIGLAVANRILISATVKLGFSGISDIGTLPVLSFVLFGFMLITLPINNTFSRKLERQADTFSIETTNNPDSFISSMKKLAVQNLADTTPNPVIHFILHSHPSISERIKMAEKFIK